MHIRPFECDDFPALQEFLRSNYPNSPLKADERFFRWRFMENPLGSTLDRYLLAFEGKRLIGQMAAIRDNICVSDVRLPADWLVDLMIAPEFRGGITALQLFQAHMKKGDLLLATGAGPQMLRLYEALGWLRFDVVRTFYALRRPYALWAAANPEASALRAGGLTTAALKIGDVVIPAARGLCALLPRFRPTRFRIAPIKTFDGEFDEFIGRVLPHHGLTSFRNSAQLTWKFSPLGTGACFGFLARNTSDHKLSGYVVVKLMNRASVAKWAEIVDFLVDPAYPDVLSALLAAVQRRGDELNLDFARLRCSQPDHRRRLHRPFWIPKSRPVIDDIFVYAKDNQTQRLFSGATWHGTSFMSDRADHGGDQWTINPATSAS